MSAVETAPLRLQQGRVRAVDLPLALLLAAGVALRVVPFASRRSLWIDEACLAVNIAGRGYWSLFPPLDHDQSAPLGFLWAERAVVQLLGVTELSLRLVPLLAGLSALFLTYPVARRFINRNAALLATGFAAVGPTLVYYSSEVKQYSTEVLATLGLLWLAADWLDRPDRARTRRLLIAGALAVWVSAPSVFVLAGIGTAGAVRAVRDRSGLRGLAYMALTWGASFAAAYFMVYREAAANPYMRRYWDAAFLTTDPPGFPFRLWAGLRSVFWGTLLGRGPRAFAHGLDPLVEVGTALMATLVVLGVIGVWRSRGSVWTALLLGPLGMALLAAGIGRYPFALRVMLFAAPVLQILVAAGVGLVAERRGARFTPGWRWAPLLLVLPLVRSAADAAPSTWREHIRPGLEYLAAHRRGEPVYVSPAALPVWEFYTTDWRRIDRARLSFINDIARPGLGPAFPNAPSRGRPVATDEGRDLVYHDDAGLELFGISSGVEVRTALGVVTPEPDSGWAAHEASRIKAVADPAVWVVMSRFQASQLPLLHELDKLGGRVTYRYSADRALVERIEFR